MILNELFNLSELSSGTLASYKKKAGADASAADAAGDYARGNKRFKGIVKATKKQFANDTKGMASYPETQNVDEAYDPAEAAKIIGVATKAGIRIFYDKFSSDSNFRNQIDAEYGFKYQDIKISAISTAIGFAKSAMAWLNARGAYLTYNPKNPVDFQLTMPNQPEPYTFNVFDVMERWKPYAESAPAAGNRTAKFDPSTGLPVGKQLSELEGDVANYPPVAGTPPQNQPNTEQPPRRGYSIMLTGKPGRDYRADYVWQALEKVLPRDYPEDSIAANNSDNGLPETRAMRKVIEAHRGPVVVKSGIANEDIAETLVAKLVANRVPAQYWQITSQDLSEGVAEGLGNIGGKIKSVYQKIDDSGPDATEYMYYDSPIFAQYWDEYEGDLDSIIAEVDPSELQIILDELESAAADQGVAEGSNDYFKRRKDEEDRIAGVKAPAKRTPKQTDYEKKRKQQDMSEGLPQTLRKVVPGYAKREIDRKMDAGKFGKTDADKDANFQRYKQIQDKLKEQDMAEGLNDRGFFNNVEQWHEAKSEIEHDDQWETPKYIVVKNNDKTVAKWSKADSYGWVDSSQQDMAEGNELQSMLNSAGLGRNR